MLDSFNLNAVELQKFRQEVRHQAQQALDRSSLRPLIPSLCQILTRPNSLMAHEPLLPSSWRWSLLLPKMYNALNPTCYQADDVACLSAIVECLQIASERQTPVSSTGILDGDKALYAYHYSLNQNLYSLALELALASGKSRNACNQSLARCRSVNSTVMQLNLALHEESEQLLAEVVGEETYILTIGRRQAALGGGTTQLAALAANLTTPEIEQWRQFGFNLGITFELIQQLEFYTNDKPLPQQILPLKSLPFVYARTLIESEEGLVLAWHKGEWQLVKSLVRQSGALEFIRSLARDWLEKTDKTLNSPPAFLKPLLNEYRHKLQSFD